jgi:predicted regulator of Ras-like GTPase activity (Roadblock/LC7/MglB family)
MPTIRELVRALRQRDGVDAVVVLGRDGLVIDSQSAPGIDAEALAALAPPIVAAAEELGRHQEAGRLTTTVLEFEQGYAVASILGLDAVLVVLAGQDAEIGPLLYELRRNHGRIASIV